jgi:hypothetical protein
VIGFIGENACKRVGTQVEDYDEKSTVALVYKQDGTQLEWR